MPFGPHRLIQTKLLPQRHRCNTGMLLAATLAVVTGRMMKEEWLPAGELNRAWDLAHWVA